MKKFFDRMEKCRRVYCIGETVLDIIFREGIPVAAKPGGSMLNSAVSLGRAGIPVSFISDFAKDQAGDIILNFLLQNHVGTNFIDRYEGGKTALALAFLDEHKDADYSFYKLFPKKRLNIVFPEIQQNDIILFGSFYALTESVRIKILTFVRKAKSAGAFILYDPNFRKPHLRELQTLLPRIRENISLASMVRGSDQDFALIFGATDAVEAFNHVSDAGCPLLVYTRNKDNVVVVANGYHSSFKVNPIVPVSTIGAGDAFNAGMIYAIYDTFILGSNYQNWSMNPNEWPLDILITRGLSFSSNVCQSLDNYISTDFASQLKND